jgi:DNA-binding transcriptional LysR family regulator
MGMDGWPNHRHPRRIRYQVSLMESALELCRRGLAVAYLPAFIARLHDATTSRRAQLVELACPVRDRDREQSVFLLRGAHTPPAIASVERLLARQLRALG